MELAKITRTDIELKQTKTCFLKHPNCRNITFKILQVFHLAIHKLSSFADSAQIIVNPAKLGKLISQWIAKRYI